MSYIYTPPQRPRTKPLRAAFNAAYAFSDSGWHTDGYCAVRRPLPESVEEVELLIDGKRPALKAVIKALWQEIQAGEYAVAVPIASFIDDRGDDLNSPGERVIFKVGKGKQANLYLVAKPRLDYVMAYSPHAEIHGHVKTWTRALAVLEGSRLVGALMPIMYAQPSWMYSKVQQAIKEAGR
jgi:hypothetical protein